VEPQLGVPREPMATAVGGVNAPKLDREAGWAMVRKAMGCDHPTP